MSPREGSNASHSPTPLPELILYGKPGCHLCDGTRALLDELLRGRAAAGLPVAAVAERNILANPDWERAHFETIPVLEFGGRQLPLAIRPAEVRRFLGEALGEVSGEAPGEALGEAPAPSIQARSNPAT